MPENRDLVLTTGSIMICRRDEESQMIRVLHIVGKMDRGGIRHSDERYRNIDSVNAV